MKPVETAIARIFSSSGGIVGLGFLISRNRIMTCAHVVADAVGISRDESTPPQQTISVDFPLVDDNRKCTAKVVVWLPSRDGTDDIAVLELNETAPQSTTHAHLIAVENPWGLDFGAYGFPQYNPKGVWASGKVKGKIEGNRIQVEDVEGTSYFIEPGFSGSPVYCDNSEISGVIGMVVSAEADASIKAGFMIPSQVLLAKKDQIIRKQVDSSEAKDSKSPIDTTDTASHPMPRIYRRNMQPRVVYIGRFEEMKPVRQTNRVFVAHRFFGGDAHAIDDYRYYLEDGLAQIDYVPHFNGNDSGTLLETICQDILNTEAGIYDVSDYNANVLIELGMSIGLNQPTIVIAEDDSQPLIAPLQQLNPLRYVDPDDLEDQIGSLVQARIQKVRQDGVNPLFCAACGLDCIARKYRRSPEDEYLLIGADPNEDKGLFKRLKKATKNFNLTWQQLDGEFNLTVCRWVEEVKRSRIVFFHSKAGDTKHSGIDNATTMVRTGIAIGLGVAWRMILEGNDDMPTDLKGYKYISWDRSPRIFEATLNAAVRTLLGEARPYGGMYDPLVPVEAIEDDEEDLTLLENEKVSSGRIFIAYSRQDGEVFAVDLRNRLEQKGFGVWRDREQMEGGVGWWYQIVKALENVEFMVLIATPAAMASSILRKEWRTARLMGVCVYPVQVPGMPIDFDSMPRWMQDAHFYDLDHEWDTFINYLKIPCEVPKVPFMAPDKPDYFVARPTQFDTLKSQLLDKSFDNPVAITTALKGAGGFGKTTLAIALCHDEDVQTAFDEGVLWVTLGENPDIVSALTKLYRALTGENPGFIDAEEGANLLAEKLIDADVLMVIDDVWETAHLRHFLRGGERCARLITTRFYSVGMAAGANLLEIDEMTTNQSVQLLFAGIINVPDDLTPFKELAQRLGEWPLLLKIANGMLRRRLAHGADLNASLSYVNDIVDKRGLEGLQTGSSEPVTRVLDLSIEQIEKDDQSHLFELAIFSEDMDIPLTSIMALWDKDDFDTEGLIEQFDDLSFVRFFMETRSIRLHDVVREILASRIDDSRTIHAQLVDGWRDPYFLPDEYAWRYYIYHVVKAERTDQAKELLKDVRWLQAKLDATDVDALLTDYAMLPDDTELQQLARLIEVNREEIPSDPAVFLKQLVTSVVGKFADTFQELDQPRAEPLPLRETSVFLCYSRRDLDFVRQLSEAMLAQGQDTWIDWRDIPLATNWWEEIKKGIASSDNFILMMSPNSMSAPICHLEIEYARQLNKRIIPVLYQDYDRATCVSLLARRIYDHDDTFLDMLWGQRQPHTLFDENDQFLKRINWVFFRPEDNFDDHFQRLMEVIHTDYEYLAHHTKLQLQALEWERRERDPSFLLVGTRLAEAEAWLASSSGKMPSPTLVIRQYIEASRNKQSGSNPLSNLLRRIRGNN